jgi:transcriptional regulator of heat shock response
MLTARQRNLLKIIIEEFINTAEAVGSLDLGEKYDLEVSPATIRNEMASLSEEGLLEKLHASSGRVPTTKAIKWFLKEALDEYEELEISRATRIKEELFQKRFSTDKLLMQAVSSLSDLTGNTALAMLDGRRFTSGISRFIDQPEYQDVERLKKILSVMEDYQAFSELFSRYSSDEDIRVLVGEETGIDSFSDSAVAFAGIKIFGRDKGYLAVIGPNRMNYARVIPAVKYIVLTIQDVVKGW